MSRLPGRDKAGHVPLFWLRCSMSAMQRRKGAAGEREVLKLLGDELGVLLSRNLQQTREGGADCIALKGFAIEVKRQTG